MPNGRKVNERAVNFNAFPRGSIKSERWKNLSLRSVSRIAGLPQSRQSRDSSLPEGAISHAVSLQDTVNQVTQSEPSDNLGRVRAIRCGFGAGAPGKIKAPCVWFDGIAFAFRFFYFSRGCPCLENRFAAANGKDGNWGFGVSPKLFSFLSFGYKREDENKKWKIKKQKNKCT